MAREIIPLAARNKVFLSPMEEVNDQAFRLLCKRAGAGLTYTPLTSPLSPKPVDLDDEPVLQLFGAAELLENNSKQLKEFMKKYDSKVVGWDFNLGCPATTAKRHRYGSYLDSPEVLEKIIQIMRENTGKPLSIKIRKSPFAYDYLKIAEKYCDAIAIHPRTREQAYSGDPDIEYAKEFKKKSTIPVIYSGNIDEENYEEFLKIFDYVMIGRKAMGHPEIFSKITGTPFKKSFKDYLALAKKYGIHWRNIKFQAMQFTKGDENSRKKRAEMIKAKTIEELEEIFFDF
jgi:tRNA-dihydrouridine synthase